jgi:hypothetical protein
MVTWHYQAFRLFLLPAPCWFLAWPTLRPSRWLNFSGLHGIISQLIEISIATAVSASDSTALTKLSKLETRIFFQYITSHTWLEINIISTHSQKKVHERFRACWRSLRKHCIKYAITKKKQEWTISARSYFNLKVIPSVKFELMHFFIPASDITISRANNKHIFLC